MSKRSAAWPLLPVALLLCVLLLSFSDVPDVAEARSYEFESLVIQAEILPDGSMAVQEQRTARFSGTFGGMFQWIDKQPGVKITDVQISENGQPYKFRPGATEYGPAGTYYITDKPNQLYVDWSFQATDERRTFTISYRVQKQVQVHADVAELYYQFIGDQWEQGVRRVQVSLTLPSGAAQQEIKAWGHGPLYGEVSIVDGSHVLWTIDDLPAKTFLEGRVTFPRNLITGDQAVNTSRTALPGILQEEQRWADQANAVRDRARFRAAVRKLDRFTWVLVPLATFLLIWHWRRRFGRPYATTFQGDYYRELPADYPPAEMGVLWRFGDPTTDDFTATILDLARRKYLRIDETRQQGRGLFGGGEKVDYRLTKLENAEPLTAPEQDVLRFLFEQVAEDGRTVSFDEIERYAKRHASAFQSFWRGWVGSVRFSSDRHEFFDQSAELKRGRNLQLLAAGLCFLLGVGAVMLFILPLTGMGLSVGAVALLISAGTMQRRSQRGQEEYVRWQAFRRFLQHFSQLERHGIPALVIWEHYLVYAVSLGVAKEVLKQLELVFPNLESEGHRFGAGWYYYGLGHHGFYGMTNGLTTMTTSLSQSMQTSLRVASSPQSSGMGGGGGFSGGGGFGGGGGGGGVR